MHEYTWDGLVCPIAKAPFDACKKLLIRCPSDKKGLKWWQSTDTKGHNKWWQPNLEIPVSTLL